MGINVYKPYEDVELPTVAFGDFLVKAFPVPHDGTECYGFVIRADGETGIYVTDFEYCTYNFAKLKPDFIIVECNYDDKLINKDAPNYIHKLIGHCGLNTCKDFLKANATEKLRSVILVHLGEGIGDTENIVSEVKAVLPDGVKVEIARPGLKGEL